jgi:hypothetical protein
VKYEPVHVPNPDLYPDAFLDALEDNFELIEAAVENAAFRTGDTMEADLILSGGVVGNGTIVEGEPNDAVEPDTPIVEQEHSIAYDIDWQISDGTPRTTSAGFVLAGDGNIYASTTPIHYETGFDDGTLVLDGVDITGDWVGSTSSVEIVIGQWCTDVGQVSDFEARVMSSGTYTPAEEDNVTGSDVFGEWVPYAGGWEVLLNTVAYSDEEFDAFPGPKDAVITLQYRRISTGGNLGTLVFTVHNYQGSV